VNLQRPRGPDMKMPDVKVPDFLADLYYDLRDRRLLPLVALILVAIVATPLLLGDKSEPELPPAAEGAISALGESSGRTSRLTVVEAKPGLRDYRKRLGGRKPTDPFRSLGGSGGSGSEGSSSRSTSTTSTSTTTTSTGSGSSGGGGGAPASTQTGTSSPEATGGGNGSGGGQTGGGKSGGGQPQNVTLYTYAADLTITHSSGSQTEGNKKTDPTQTRKGVLGPTTLPSDKVQVVTYLGRSPKTHRALFLVSSEVTGVFGEGKCAAGTGVCGLIELEIGLPEIFEYGEGSDRYIIKVTKLEPVPDGHS
jgi:hypothetical protein